VLASSVSERRQGKHAQQQTRHPGEGTDSGLLLKRQHARADAISDTQQTGKRQQLD
jgi:hypothetical protein